MYVAVNQENQVTHISSKLAAFPLKDPSKYAPKLLSVSFTDYELIESNCMRAEGRKLLNQDVIIAIKLRKVVIIRYYDYKCNRVPSFI